jgi:hypothetical protein
MANFYTLTFYLDANRQEQIYKSKCTFAGLLLAFINSTLNSLHSAPFISPHARENMKVKAFWWGQDHWETDHDYQVSDIYESCTLILVDEDLADKGLEYFQLLAGTLLMQAGFSPKKPNRAEPPEVISLKPGIWGINIDLRALWKVFRQRWWKTS